MKKRKSKHWKRVGPVVEGSGAGAGQERGTSGAPAGRPSCQNCKGRAHKGCDLCDDCAAELIRRMVGNWVKCAVCEQPFALANPRRKRIQHLCWVCARLSNSAEQENLFDGLPTSV